MVVMMVPLFVFILIMVMISVMMVMMAGTALLFMVMMMVMKMFLFLFVRVIFTMNVSHMLKCFFHFTGQRYGSEDATGLQRRISGRKSSPDRFLSPYN